MPATDSNLASRSGNLVETHKSYQPRVVFFYFVLALLFIILVTGLAYQQIFQTANHQENERVQNQRRILIPGPRGNIYDRNGNLLVGNRPRLAVVLYLDELRAEIYRKYVEVRTAYRASGDRDLPTDRQLRQIARTAVVQRYLDEVNKILGRSEKVDGKDLENHFTQQQMLLPYALIEDLEPEEYARLVERLPVKSPLQVYTSSARFYPYGSAAAHTLGYVGLNEDVVAEDFPGEDLTTIKMKGTVGRDGLEKRFDSLLQGETGGIIFRVDPAGYKINPPLEKRTPVQGKSLTTSLDIDLQLAAEEAIGEQTGTAVALDVRTGEVLALANKPSYNLSDFSPRLTQATVADIQARKAWNNSAIAGAYPPGSTFKILTTIAALRRGAIKTDESIIDCEGVIYLGKRAYVCYNGRGHHGNVLLRDAIATSCDIYFYEAGRLTTPLGIADEARRFHLDRPTGIELPNETTRMLIADPDWKRKNRDEAWTGGDTANMAIGQGFTTVSPLQMACFVASVARNEVFTKPTLLHRPNAAVQHTESIGLTAEQRSALLDGMEAVTVSGTGRLAFMLPATKIPGVRVAGKTGTAQKEVTIDGKKGNINYGWFICFAPIENPEIAVAAMIEGDVIGEETGGGLYGAPVANAILRKYFAKKAAANQPKP
jgi:penicillin-binding protein 2